MTPEELAHIHQVSIETPKPWDAKAFAGFLQDPTVRLLSESGCFLLMRSVAEEAEILTLAVVPAMRRKGKAFKLLTLAIEEAAQSGAKSMFLEVAEDNSAAISLYEKAKFLRVGVRKNYYRQPNGNRVDAIVMRRSSDLSTG